MKKSFLMIKLSILLTVVVFSTSCSLYPLGHSKYGNYYGGQGNAVAPRVYVPKAIQRQEPLVSLEFKSPE